MLFFLINKEIVGKQGKWQRNNYIGHAWIRTTVRQGVLQESISATTFDMHTRAIYLYSLYLYSLD